MISDRTRAEQARQKQHKGHHPHNGNGKPQQPAARNVPGVGIRVQRRHTKPGVNPFDEVEWELRKASITGEDGKSVFEQKDVEVPKYWSQMATNVVVSKYFRGALGTPQREKSVRQLISRVADTISGWGKKNGYFNKPGTREVDENVAQTFHAELTWILLHQHMAFNSPVWFNVGVEKDPQCSACFINSVGDSMGSILDLAKTEGMLFKYGSGTGSNLSAIRSSKEALAGGGTASGPVSFMKGFDSFAGVIKSGGKTRRAAKMVILNVDHPDILQFIKSKADEERKAWALIDAGYDGAFNVAGGAYDSVQFQNANHSVRVTDDFMHAVVEDREWKTRRVTDGEVSETFRARDLWKEIAEAAWVCGDPGVQYDTTVNDWHTCPNTARINASNPCVTGDTLVATKHGLMRIDSLIGKETEVVAGDGKLAPITGAFRTGTKDVYLLRTESGYTLKLTADHKVRTLNRGDVPAAELTKDDVVELAGSPFGKSYISRELAQIVGLAVGDGCISQGVLTLAMAPEERSILDEAAAFMNSVKPNRPVNVSEGGATTRLATTADEVVSEVSRWAVLDQGSAGKRLTDAALTLDRPSLAALLRGLFTTDGTVANYGDKSQYVALDSVSLDLLRQVQGILLSFGIKAKIYENRRALDQATSLLPDGKGGMKAYPVQQIHSLRISRSSRLLFEREIGFWQGTDKARKLSALNAEHQAYADRMNDAVLSLERLGTEDVYDLTEPRTSHFVANGIVVHNCSEYMFLDDSACNLASLNLMKYRRPDGSFDTEAFRHDVEITFLAMEIIVGCSKYPTEAIARNSHDYRPLGLGYANLGAYLMSNGYAYDSPEGRSFCGAVTAIMTGHAFATSSRIAASIGPFAGYARNREPFLRVMKKHRAAVSKIDQSLVEPELHKAAASAWDEAVELGELYGYRNSQATVIAPTGTIAFLMDCDTTGIEPDIALVKYKKLVGGGTLKIVNQTVPAALKRLGYDDPQVKEICEYIDANGTIEGAAPLKNEHLPVFDCAFKPANGTRSIHYAGHIRMMAAAQPFISGAISKTVNMPHNTTAEEIARTYEEAWRLGLKAVAIYRDGCKRTQPLSTSSDKDKAKLASMGLDTPRAVRRPLPEERQSITHKFSVGGHDGYITVGKYEDGSPGEIFLVAAKEGSTVSGLMDSFATSISLALQYGVPLKVLVDKFSHTRFEPSGFTNNPRIPIAKSISDYIFRWLGDKFLNDEERLALGVHAPELEKLALAPAAEAAPAEEPKGPVKPLDLAVREQPSLPLPGVNQHEKRVFQAQADAPPCPSCGEIMVRNAACYKCLNCGTTSGCS